MHTGKKFLINIHLFIKSINVIMRMLTARISARRYVTRYYQYVIPIFKNFRAQHGRRGVMSPP